MNSIRRGLHNLWRVLIVALFAAGVVQFFLAGAGAFGAQSFETHETVGHVMFIPGSVLLLLLVGLAWLDRTAVLWQAVLVVLLFVQVLLAGAGEDEPWVGAFHPVNALLILGLSGWLAHRAWRRRRELPPPEAAAAPR